MKLAIMQPYFFPYIGYFQLINSVDKFVLYDNIQFSKSGWFNRNRILVNGEDRLFSLPIKKDSDYLHVKQRYLAEYAIKHCRKIINQMKNSYGKALYFNQVFPLIEQAFFYNETNLFQYIY